MKKIAMLFVFIFAMMMTGCGMRDSLVPIYPTDNEDTSAVEVNVDINDINDLSEGFEIVSTAELTRYSYLEKDETLVLDFKNDGDTYCEVNKEDASNIKANKSCVIEEDDETVRINFPKTDYSYAVKFGEGIATFDGMNVKYIEVYISKM